MDFPKLYFISKYPQDWQNMYRDWMWFNERCLKINPDGTITVTASGNFQVVV